MYDISFEDFVLKDVDIIKESDTTGDIDIFKPKLTHFGNYKCVDVDANTYHKLVFGKIPYRRWKYYISGDDETKDTIQNLYYKERKILVRNKETREMTFFQ